MVAMPQRMPELPNVQTARELGLPEMERIVGWTALIGPPGMAKEATDKWVDTLAKLARDPDWLAGNARISGIPAIRSPADTAAFFNDQYDLYFKLANQLGIRE
jgi:tripartite-type tricarboxylate transporter receptor subunit TctC